MVMFTGNGRHIVVVFAFDRPFEKIADFQRYIDRLPPTSSLSINPISKEFLRYAKDYLSNGQADAADHPNFRSMFLRVPGTMNTKIKGQYELVRLEHDIDYTSPICGFKDLHNTLISGFMDHLDDLSLAYKIKLDSWDQRQRKISKVTSIGPTLSLSYQYVDKLLQTPVKDHREFCIWRILGPYLLNIKYLSYESTFKIIMDWLSKCDALSLSKFYNEESVRTRLDKVGSFLPLTEASLRSLNRELYNMIITQ